MTLYDSVKLTNEVADRMEDLPSGAVISIHSIVKHTIAVLDEWGFLVQVGAAVGEDNDE